MHGRCARATPEPINPEERTLELAVRGERVTIYRQNILHITERTRTVTEERKCSRRGWKRSPSSAG
jgi:hypothetical protein